MKLFEAVESSFGGFFVSMQKCVINEQKNMETFLNLAEKRRSVRRFEGREVEQEKIDYILECARMAPSAVNYQPWRVAVIRDQEGLEKLRKCYSREWFASVPACMVILGDKGRSWKRPYDGHDHADIDVAIFTEHLCLAATEVGLGTCWVCYFDPEEFARQFDLPDNLYPVVLLPFGYPADQAQPKKRLSTEEILIEL